jgi:hypothetical protein
MKTNATIVSGILALVLIAVFVNTNRAAVRDLGSGAELQGVRGDLKVSYEMVTRSGDSVSTTPVADQACSAVEFHEQYVVLRYKVGGGRLLPLEQFRNLRWDGK